MTKCDAPAFIKGMKLNQVIAKLKKEKAITAIHWYFNSTAAKYGVANGIGGVWTIEISKTLANVRARLGKPSHLSPTPKLASGLRKALSKLAA